MTAEAYPDGRRVDIPITPWSHDWLGQAACKGMGPSLFFGPGEGQPKEPKAEKAAREQRAKAVCGGCPVRDACLGHALDNKEPDGIWGGLGPEERKNLDKIAQRSRR